VIDVRVPVFVTLRFANILEELKTDVGVRVCTFANGILQQYILVVFLLFTN
jgi:hypothetical protein